MASPQDRVSDAYRTLLSVYGPQGWWPSRGPFEMMVGAVLTQHASWRNAERAIEAMRSLGLLAPEAIVRTSPAALARIIRSSGPFTRKAETLIALAWAVREHGRGLEQFLSLNAETLRTTLLAIRGIGPETADAIVLYAAGKAAFVVDAYTRRFVVRHGLVPQRASYAAIQELFTRALPQDVSVYAECHALLVRLGKDRCRATRRCAGCPLEGDLDRHASGRRPPASARR
ncbi:MAG: hypothetical protein FJY74_03920 [Candidatus Eisenbacteria bacterium]|nr:hypothetical protein [Candidatus Eisenbacteria bacterium]